MHKEEVNMKKIISLMLVFAMLMALMPAVFAVEGDVFVKVTDAAELAVGDQIIIVSDTTDHALGTTQNNNNRAAVAITKDGDTVTATADVQVLTLEAGTTDGTFAFNTGAGYLYAASSSKNYLRTETTLSANSSWAISIADGVASVVAQGTNTRATMQYNSSANLFACYSGATQKAIAIYKLVVEEAEPENVLVLGENTLTSGIEYTYTVPADGRLELDILTVKDSAGSTIYSYTFNKGERVQVLVDGQPITLDAQRCNVTAGQKITVQVVSVDADTYTVTLNLAEVEAAQVLNLGENDVAQDLEYVYTAEQSGTLYVSIVELLYNGEQATESDLGSSVLYQINSASVSSFDKSYEVEAGDETAIVIEDYSWDGSGTVSAVIYLSYEGFYAHPAGSLANPVELLYADCPTKTIEIAAGTAVWYELESYYDDSAWSTVYPFEDKDLVVTGEGAYVIVDGTRYDAVDGVVTVRMNTETLIQIGNDGAETAIFDIAVQIPEGHEDNPQDLVEGDNTVTLPSYGSHYFDFVAAEDGTVTVTITGENWRAYFYHYDAEGNELAQEDRFAKNSDSNVFTVEIKAGERIVINLGTSKGYSQPGGELTVNFHFEPAEAEEPANTLVLGENTLTSGIEYTYTVPADGRLELDILTVKDSAGSTIYSYAFNQGTRVQVLVDGEPITLDANRRNVTAGQVITVLVVSVDGDTYTVTLNLAEVEPAQELVLGENDVAQDLEYVYIAENDGTLYISIVELLYNGEQATESELGNNVKYMINGVSVYSFDKSYEVKAGDEISIVIEDYSWSGDGVVSAVIYLSYEGFYTHPAGSLANPVELLYADCPTKTIEIAAGTAAWYQLESYYDDSAWSTVYPFDGKYLVVTGENAYVIVDGVRYDAENGVVKVLMDEQTLIQIGNDGAAAAIFDISVEIPEGHKENPQDLVEGDNTVTLPSYGSHYFDFTATEDGTVTITITGDNWRAYFYHYDAEGNELAQDDYYAKNGDSNIIVVEIKAGESILINLGTSQGWSQPGGELTVNFHFEPAAKGLMGDVNGDGFVDVEDAMMILQYEVGMLSDTDLNLLVGDVSGDGFVDVEDAMLILQYEVGLIEKFPVEE